MPRQGDRSFQNSHEYKFQTGSPTITRRTTIGGRPKVVSYVILGERLRSCITERKSEQLLSRLTFFVIVR